MNVKFLIPLTLSIILGFIFSKLVYAQYNKEIDKRGNAYFLQQGVYADNEALKAETKNLEYYISEEKDNKYYVYVGITTSKENANKIKSIYDNKNIKINIIKEKIDDVYFLSNLQQYDVLLSSTSKYEDILSINRVILSSYDDILTN